MSPSARVAWHGEFVGEGSLARVNRHLVKALVAGGATAIVPCGEPMPDVERMLSIEPHRREDLPNDGRPLVTVRHRWPPRFMNPPAGWYVHIQPWEFGALPQAWADALRTRADAVWCYSRYVRDVYIAAGLEPDRTAIMPLGFDPEIYRPDGEALPVSSPTTCIFLFVGGIVDRKNVYGAIEAFCRAFTPGDDVALLIKDNPRLGVYDVRARAGFDALLNRTDIPPIRLLEDQFSDADMARLYRTAAALVHPYRGEGFGLPVLEAMACGLPVIVSRGGATDDFVDPASAYSIPANRVSLGTSIDGLPLASEGWWLDPDPAALTAAMRNVYEQRDAARARGAHGAAFAHGAWTWAHAATHAARLVEGLVARPARPPDDAIDTPEGYGESALYEVFSRLRCAQPQFASTEPHAPGALAALRWGWSAVGALDATVELDLLDLTGVPDLAAARTHPAARRARVVTAGEAVYVRDDLRAVAGFTPRTGPAG
jgi:glycosyltransferase involved in cell wall biosynthesis